MFSLNTKKTLVTGATGGIGGSIVRALHGAGASVALSGSRVEKLTSLMDVILSASEGSPSVSGDSSATPQNDKRLLSIPCNLSDLDNVDTLIKQAEEQLGGLDVLVLNAGITRDNLAMRMKDEEWQQVIDINLTANFKLARAALKGMIKRRAGRIIFITSVVGHAGNPGQANYCASKAGLTGMAKSFAHEVASRGITVNCIAPGFIATEMTDALTDDQKAKINANIPLSRMGTADEIAAATLYLASDEAGYMTGQTLHVNGGMYMA